MGVEIHKGGHKNPVRAGRITVFTGNKLPAVNNPFRRKAAAFNFFFGKNLVKSRFAEGNNFPDYAILNDERSNYIRPFIRYAKIF
jgi:hypothetical protein